MTLHHLEVPLSGTIVLVHAGMSTYPLVAGQRVFGYHDDNNSPDNYVVETSFYFCSFVYIRAFKTKL